jgi:hypothetical protein
MYITAAASRPARLRTPLDRGRDLVRTDEREPGRGPRGRAGDPPAPSSKPSSGLLSVRPECPERGADLLV